MLKNVLIGTNVSYTTAATPSALAAGEIGVYSVSAAGAFTRLTDAATGLAAANAGLPIMIAQGAATGRNIKSFMVPPKAFGKAYLNSAYVAPVPSVWTAGYDGVIATYDLTSGTAGTYGFKIQNTSVGNPPFPTLSSTPSFQTAGAATSIAIANAIVKDVNSQALLPANLVVPEQNFAFSEVLSSGTTAQMVDGSAGNVTSTVINGSANVVLTATGTITIAAGAYIKFGSAAATTAAIYKVKTGVSAATSPATIELESPYVNAQVALGTSIATLATGTASAATINAATAGIRVTEYGNRFNGSNVLEPQFNTTLNLACSVNLSGTPMQNNQTVARGYTAAAGTPATGTNPALSGQLLPYTEGVGTYSQVFKKELWAAGYSGFINRSFLPDNFPIYSVAGTNYATIGLQYTSFVNDYTAQGFIAGESLNAILAVPTGSGQLTNLGNVLNSTNGYFSV
jgi:hypothetical protein